MARCGWQVHTSRDLRTAEEQKNEDSREKRLTTTDLTRADDGSDAEGWRRFGSYRLLQRLGEGGMGEVWLAQQLEPVQRQVAVKLIKPGMDSARVIARFEAERQTLALMDHPAISKVFDAGTTPEGRPYFAMEYVRGDAITTYCDRQRLTVRDRIELFIQLCDGVQHAHQKGIIHRDLNRRTSWCRRRTIGRSLASSTLESPRRWRSR
jgi:serine/threonine protein kinase